MSGKNQFPVIFNWQATSPVTNFLPNPYQPGSLPSGQKTGAMASTNTIYSQIVDISRMDNISLDVDWTGTPMGTFSVMLSNGGVNFHTIPFNPALYQPSGGPGGFGADLTLNGFKYILLQYVNASGTGSLTVVGQLKDLN